MLDPVIEFFKSVFAAILAGLSRFIALILAPFIWIRNLYRSSGKIIKAIIAVILLCIIIPYGFFFWNVLWVRNYDVDYVSKLNLNEIKTSAGEAVSIEGGSDTTKTCGRSSIVDVSTELLDFNVNQNSWISASLLYKLGLFGIPWDSTPWMDNKASFQRGVHRSVAAAAIELRDSLGRTRGTSERDKNLNQANRKIQISEFNWYAGLNPPGFREVSWSAYREAMSEYKKYNDRLLACDASFDARADNLINFMDRIAKDIGSMTAVIRDRAEQYNGGWLDMRADNIFMEANGQLYGYYGFLRAARVDFQDIIEARALTRSWDQMLDQFQSALALDPLIISNGKEDGVIMPTHITTMGFYILRIRANLTEMRDVLKN